VSPAAHLRAPGAPPGRRLVRPLGRRLVRPLGRRLVRPLGRRLVRPLGRRLVRPPGPRLMRPLAVLGAALLALLAAAPPASAGSVRVSQCRPAADGPWTPTGFQSSAWWVAGGWPEVECGFHGGVVRLGTPNWRLAENAAATLYFVLPDTMPRTSARAAWVDWRFSPQSASTNPAFLSMTASGARLLTAVPGEGAVTRRELPAGSRGLELTVWCSPVNGPGWCNWPGPLLGVHGFTVELEESVEPNASATGPLLEPRAQSGIEPLAIAASDGDTGVRRVAVTLGGVAVGTLGPADGCRDDRMPPCPQSVRGSIDVDTRLVPDGARRLRLAVTDAAGNARTVEAGTVQVANQSRVQTPPGPEPGGGSGGVATPAPVTAPAPAPLPVAAAQPRPFPPNPLAGRGHVPNGRGATAAARLAAWLEPGRGRSGAPLRRRATTVPYGVRVRIRGRLTGRRGRGIGRATLAAVRREPGRPWRVVTGVRTRPDGRFTAFTRIGPSQEVRFVYYAYGDSARGRLSPTLRVRVAR
jgi:hypothetical protein